MNTIYNERKQSANIALECSILAAIIFFAGMCIVIMNMSADMNRIGTTAAVGGGIFLIGSYLTMKYAILKLKILREGNY